MKDEDGNYINDFRKNVNDFLDKNGLSYLFHLRSISGTEMNNIIQRIKDVYIQSWYSDVNESN